MAVKRYNMQMHASKAPTESIQRSMFGPLETPPGFYRLFSITHDGLLHITVEAEVDPDLDLVRQS